MNEPNSFLDKINKGVEIKDFWLQYRKFCRSTEPIDLDLFTATLPSLFNLIKSNNAGYDFFDIVERNSSKNFSFGANLYEIIRKSPEKESWMLLPSIITGLAKSEDTERIIGRIKELLAEDEIEFKRAAIFSTLKIQIADPEVEQNFNNYVFKEYQKLIDLHAIELHGSLMKAYILKLNKVSNVKEIVIRLLKEGQVEAQTEVIYSLNRHITADDDYDFYSKIIMLLTKLDTKYIGYYNTLTYQLEMIIDSHPDLVIKFLEKWVEVNFSHLKKIELFKHLFHNLYLKKKDKFEELFTRWLNSDNTYFHYAIYNLVSSLSLDGIREISLSKKILSDLKPNDLEYIIFKTMGFVYDKDLASSILFSILESKSHFPDTVKLIKKAYVGFLIFNYYSVQEYLKGKKKGVIKRISKIIDEICITSDQYYDAFGNLPIVNEFSPSEIRMNHFNKVQSKFFNKSFEENKESQNSFLDTVTTINLRTGKSSFVKLEGQYSDMMTPQLISHNTEMPRGEFIDRVGQLKLRLIWQNQPRKI